MKVITCQIWYSGTLTSPHMVSVLQASMQCDLPPRMNTCRVGHFLQQAESSTETGYHFRTDCARLYAIKA
ncbi:unnamed protein product, partial [Iphiclides podalirius]